MTDKFSADLRPTLNDLENSWPRKIGAGIRYGLFRSGPMASNGIHAGLFTRSDPRLERPDLQINLLEWSTLERSGTRVVAHEPLTGGSRALFLLFDRTVSDTEVWRALHAAASFQVSTGKIVIALSDDIDPESNLDAVIWSMVFRRKPHLDVKVLENWNPGHGPRGPSQPSRWPSL